MSLQRCPPPLEALYISGEFPNFSDGNWLYGLSESGIKWCALFSGPLCREQYFDKSRVSLGAHGLRLDSSSRAPLVPSQGFIYREFGMSVPSPGGRNGESHEEEAPRRCGRRCPRGSRLRLRRPRSHQRHEALSHTDPTQVGESRPWCYGSPTASSRRQCSSCSLSPLSSSSSTRSRRMSTTTSSRTTDDHVRAEQVRAHV